MKRALLVGGTLALAGAGLWWLSTATGPDAAPSIRERAATASTPAAGMLSTRVISGEDLPPEGTRSLFDHLIAQNDGLPYPFEKLVELIERQSPEGQKPVTVFLPLGRSLLKAQADFEHPRVLVAADFQAPNSEASLGLAPRGQLFLGFVENAREIEVLSYNEAAGRYEFQLVQDYAEDGQRRIVYARRSVCLTCHQGGTPIFPERPWNETNGQPEPAEAIVAARGSEAPYLGAPIRQPLAAPERFDELTDVGAFLVASQRAWLDGCGEGAPGASCRRQMLKTALDYLRDPGQFDPQGATAQALRREQARAWPAAGIAVPQSDLANRDPLRERRSLTGRVRDWFVPAALPGEGARDNEDLEAFEKLPRLPAVQDPLTPRPPKRVLGAGDLDAAYTLAALFSGDDLRLLEERAGYRWERVGAAIDRLPDAQFAPAPFSRVGTLQALTTALGGAAPAYCCRDTAEMSPPQAISVPPLALAAGSPLQPFADYCFACHRGNPSKRLDFMSGADEAAVAEGIRATATIRDALDWERYRGTDKEGTLMPPADAPQRARLEAALKQDPELLARMRAQVPGLFDF